MAWKPRLGTVDRENFKKISSRIVEKTLKHTRHGLSYIEDYQKGRDESTQAYGYLNALGYTYGYAMAEAYLEDFLHAEDPGAAAEIGAIVVEDLKQWENEVMGRVQPLDLHLVREAVKEVGPMMPPGPSPEAMVEVGTHYRDGMYIRDFSYSVASALQLARNDVENFLAWHKVKYPVVFNEEANQYIPELLTDVSRDEYKRAIRETNAEIKKHTYYGVSNTPIPEHPNFSILAWSNGSEAWHIMYGLIDPAVRGAMLYDLKTLRLDANYILVPFHPEIVNKILPELDPLPLFDYSLEAKLHGKYPHADDQTVRKVLRAIIDAEFPQEDNEERAIMAIDLCEIFVKAKQGIPSAEAVVTQFFLTLERPVFPYVKILEDWIEGRR